MPSLIASRTYLNTFPFKILNALLFPPSFMNRVVSRYTGLIPKIGRLFVLREL